MFLPVDSFDEVFADDEVFMFAISTATEKDTFPGKKCL